MFGVLDISRCEEYFESNSVKKGIWIKYIKISNIVLIDFEILEIDLCLNMYDRTFINKVLFIVVVHLYKQT